MGHRSKRLFFVEWTWLHFKYTKINPCTTIRNADSLCKMMEIKVLKKKLTPFEIFVSKITVCIDRLQILILHKRYRSMSYEIYRSKMDEVITNIHKWCIDNGYLKEMSDTIVFFDHHKHWTRLFHKLPFNFITGRDWRKFAHVIKKKLKIGYIL